MSGNVALIKTTSDLASIRHIQGLGKSVRRAQLTVEDEVISKKSKKNEKVSFQEPTLFSVVAWISLRLAKIKFNYLKI